MLTEGSNSAPGVSMNEVSCHIRMFAVRRSARSQHAQQTEESQNLQLCTPTVHNVNPDRVSPLLAELRPRLTSLPE